MYKPKRQFLKIIHQELFVEELDNLKNQDSIDEDDYIEYKIFSENSKYEFLNIETNCYDSIFEWNLIELQSLNYEAVLDDLGCSLASEVFEDAFFKWLRNDSSSFWLPNKEEKDFDSDVHALCKTLKVEVEDVIYNLLYALSDLLDERCFDCYEASLEFEEKILDYGY